MMILDKCPICVSSKITKYFTCIDYTCSREKFNIVSCETCGFKFTNPRPNDNEIGEYYKSDVYISHTNNKTGFFNLLYQKIRNYTIIKKVDLLKSISKGGVHLDIGCGTGEFLNACKKSGFKTKGVEPSEIARSKAIDNYGLEISSDISLNQFKEKTIDSVSMWHVLEHVTNLNDTVRNISQILKNSGKIIIAVPNHKSWDCKYYKEYWAAWDVPIHLWHFSEKTITKLFAKHNFKLVQTKPMFFDAFYVALLSEEYKNGNKNFLKSFIIGLISNIYSLFVKNSCSSHIYIFESQKKS